MLKIIILFFLIYGLLKLWRQSFGAPKSSTTETGARSTEGIKTLPGEMIACSHCGTFVLANESIHKGNRAFCSRECSTK